MLLRIPEALPNTDKRHFPTPHRAPLPYVPLIRLKHHPACLLDDAPYPPPALGRDREEAEVAEVVLRQMMGMKDVCFPRFRRDQGLARDEERGVLGMIEDEVGEDENVVSRAETFRVFAPQVSLHLHNLLQIHLCPRGGEDPFVLPDIMPQVVQQRFFRIIRYTHLFRTATRRHETRQAAPGAEFQNGSAFDASRGRGFEAEKVVGGGDRGVPEDVTPERVTPDELDS